MRISESQLRRIIRSVIKENMSPTNEFRPDTVGKTSYVDTVEKSRQDLIAKAQARAEELRQQGKQDFADELQSIFDEVLG